MTWQPIESAPKDRTRILIAGRDRWVGIAYWSNEAKFGNGQGDAPGWQIFDCEMDEWYAVATTKAKFWMPLPEPPSDNGQVVGEK